ncbi:putative alpha-ketoglutarate dehydrogenase KGD2 [Mycosarcoma maydis]|uniref:dihydrolipoyllysine-residue succinyltransferase n=1 Tax=Mycosarcoma maydis TaxID=5270 RepID=A0A0D1CAI6_MYCMD|nr:putative alpha-ketoglutarate dehydrogenase KGD2 [Ustilago maydis 521]KIS70347.1 putative alpha-ketoglutarate dehydrogenase KGD2 [Ustilago maydis 521]|eukprot:XP_011387983.1 putative alpha-ketoglutarate dehydrogenase KGD2 [Ustilago maydis 521]
MLSRSIAQSGARAARSLALRSGSVRMVTPAVARRTLLTLSAQRSLALGAQNTLLSAQRGFSSSSSRKEIVKVPQMAESITEGTLKQWNKKVGDFVKADEEVATIETDKIDVSVNAPQSGTIVEVFASEEDTVEVGKDLFKLEPGEAPAEGASSGDKQPEKKEEKKDEDNKKDESKEQKQPEKKSDDKKPAPSADPQSRPSAASSSPPASKTTSSSASSSSSSPASASSSASKGGLGSREENRVKMSRMRLRIAERLKQSQNTAASLTTFNEIDMSNLMAFRARHKDRILKEKGVKLGFMSAFAKASALALKDVPAANASIEGAGLGDTIVYRDFVDLSVAVSTDKGLVTPVVRNLESMSLIEIEQAIAELGKKARDNKLTLEDMSGGTFTISNGGVFGSLFGTPILNLPGSAILGMHAVKDKAWVVNGKVEIRPIMVVALTYDHRLLDGREAVTFLVKLKQYIEDMPSMLL